MNAPSETPIPSRNSKLFFLIALILICFNLRTGFSSPDSLLHRIETDLHLTLQDSGVFAILPVFVLGIAAPLAPRLTRFIAPRKLVLYFMLLAVGGILWRSYGGEFGLYGGMVVMGLGLGIAGATIPGIIKKHYLEKQSLMMGVYSALVSLGTSVGAAGAVPAANLFGSWRAGLAVWCIPIILAVLLWSLYFRLFPSPASNSTLNTHVFSLFKKKAAWNITLFYMTRVAGAYFILTWLPILLKGRGMSPTDAGLILSLATLTEIPAALTSHKVEKMLGGHGRLIILSLLISVLCCWGFLYAPLSWIIPFSIIFGLCIGSLFSRGMALMVEKANDETTSVELSGMAQGVGFTMGAVLVVFSNKFVHPDGPFLAFALIYTFFCLLGMIFGYRSTKPGFV